MPRPSLRPDEPRQFIFAVVLSWFARVKPLRWLGRAVEQTLFSVSPTIPRTVSVALQDVSVRSAMVSGASVGFFFCFVVNAVWSLRVGSFFGSDADRLYFTEDLPNLVNYVLLCPLYVGFSLVLISRAVVGYPTLARPPLARGSAPDGVPRLPLAVSLSVVLIVASLLTSNYLVEILDESVYEKAGWYLELRDGAGRALGAFGVYYAILNFCLMVVVLTALVAFGSLFFLCVRTARLLASEPSSSELEFETLRSNLIYFTDSYLFAKLLAVALMLNAYTWRWEQPESSLNLLGLGLALSFFGVFFVSFPRYYLELEWLKFKVRRATYKGEPIDLRHDDVRPHATRVVAHVLDLMVVSGFVLTFFAP